MCLITRQKKAKIAKEDITCYKLVNSTSSTKKVCADNYDFEYTLGKLYQTEMVVNNIPQCYADDLVAEYYKFKPYTMDRVTKNLIHVHEGFHSAISIQRFKDADYYICFNRICVECTIPKGSKYYKDGTGLLVSNKIIINKKVPYKV